MKIWAKAFKSIEEGKEIQGTRGPKFLPRTRVIIRRVRL
jgi:hypothetical protein